MPRSARQRGGTAVQGRAGCQQHTHAEPCRLGTVCHAVRAGAHLNSQPLVAPTVAPHQTHPHAEPQTHPARSQSHPRLGICTATTSHTRASPFLTGSRGPPHHPKTPKPHAQPPSSMRRPAVSCRPAARPPCPPARPPSRPHAQACPPLRRTHRLAVCWPVHKAPADALAHNVVGAHAARPRVAQHLEGHARRLGPGRGAGGGGAAARGAFWFLSFVSLGGGGGEAHGMLLQRLHDNPTCALLLCTARAYGTPHSWLWGGQHAAAGARARAHVRACCRP